MTTCELHQLAMLDGTADLAHPTSCDACREFSSAHHAATALASRQPLRTTRPRTRAIIVRGVTLAIAVVVLVTGLFTRDPREVPLQPLAAETELRVAPSDEAAEWTNLAGLAGGLQGDLHRDLSATDSTYTSFGALSQWVAPSSTLTALEN